MSNGVAVRLPLDSEPSSKDEPASAPIFAEATVDQATVPIEATIGAAAAAAVTMLCRAMEDFQAGGKLADVTKTAGAERIARLYELQQDYAGIDFNTVLRREGKLRLRQQFDAEYFRQHSPGEGDAVIDDLLGSLIEIVARVTQFERQWMS